MYSKYLPLLKKVAILAVFYLLTVGVFYQLATTNYQPDNSLAGLRIMIFVLLIPILVKYAVQLVSSLVFPMVNARRKANSAIKAASDRAKAVSVIIPAWNEEVGIIKTLKSVIATDYQQLEVIVVNDGSTDRTHHLVTNFINNFQQPDDVKNTVELKYLRLSNGGKANALNRGVAIASGEIIVTIDADSVMDKNAIKALVASFTDEKVGAVAGNVVIGNRRKSIEIMQQLEYLYGFFFKRSDSNFNSVYIIGGAAAAYRREVLQAVGGFDHEIITEDIEMSTRILAAGFKTRYAPDAVIHTEGPSDWTGLFKQRLRWKYGRLLTFIKHRELFFKSSSVQSKYLTFLLLPLAVYAEIILLLEVFLLSVFYGYTIITNDYLPLAIVIGLVTVIVWMQIFLATEKKCHRNLIAIAPVAWAVFYFIDAVELQALLRSLKRFLLKERLEWQSWVRVGLINTSLSASNDGFNQDKYQNSSNRA